MSGCAAWPKAIQRLDISSIAMWPDSPSSDSLLQARVVMPVKDRSRFNLLQQVDVSCDSHYDPIRHSFTPRKQIAPATFAVTWPDGTPCSLVEMHLISMFHRGVSVREDGGSLRATVAKLMHLIRYSWQAKRDFWELDDNDIYQLQDALMAETKAGAPLLRVRDNNTVRAIIATVVEFLLWLQDEIMVGMALIGVGADFRIRLIEQKAVDSRRNRLIVQRAYHRLPPRDTKEPKRPIGRDKRNALWEAISRMAGVTVVAPPWARGRDYEPLLSTYLKARRELLLELLEATGARPGELSRLSVSSNEDCYKAQELILVTLKRRRQMERKIKLQPGVAMRLTVFIRKHRAALLKAIESAGVDAIRLDRVFLGINGAPMSERSMVSEFSRISEIAGLSEYQSCMSMFRHRFITKQVAIHLGIYLGRESKTRDVMTDADYRTILKKVATITGHGNEGSLLHYLDLAWEELDAANQVNTAVSIDASMERSSTQIISLIGELENQAGKSPLELLQTAKEVLLNMKQELHVALAQRYDQG